MNLVLLALAVIAGALGAAVKYDVLSFGARSGLVEVLGFVIAGFSADILFLRLLPLRIRRPVVFLEVLVVLAGASGALYYFHYEIKPGFIRWAIAKAFAPKPSTVSIE